MSTNDNAPAEVFCLAEFLYDEIVARGWKTEDVAIRMGAGRNLVMDLFCLDLLMCVHDERLLINDDLFDGLATAFDISPDYFRNIHNGWLKYPDRRSKFECPDDIFGPTSRRAMIRPLSRLNPKDTGND